MTRFPSHENYRTPQVKKLCVLAHIDLGPEGDPGSGLDVAAVQRDVGAMLTCMQTMRRSEDGAYSAEEEHDRNLGEEGEDEDEVEGPWGGAVKWATPLHKVRFVFGWGTSTRCAKYVRDMYCTVLAEADHRRKGLSTGSVRSDRGWRSSSVGRIGPGPIAGSLAFQANA